MFSQIKTLLLTAHLDGLRELNITLEFAFDDKPTDGQLLRFESEVAQARNAFYCWENLFFTGNKFDIVERIREVYSTVDAAQLVLVFLEDNDTGAQFAWEADEELPEIEVVDVVPTYEWETNVHGFNSGNVDWSGFLRGAVMLGAPRPTTYFSTHQLVAAGVFGLYRLTGGVIR